jgi:serine acetyltransferase
MAGDPGIITAAIADLVAIRRRDPAAENYLRPFLYYKLPRAAMAPHRPSAVV